MLRLSDNRDRLSVVDDQIGCPTYAPDIAVAILAIARRIGSVGWQDRFARVVHLAGPDEVTWCGFARQIMRLKEKSVGAGWQWTLFQPPDYPTAAARPVNSRLCCERLASIFDIRLPPLEASLEQCMERLLDAQS